MANLENLDEKFRKYLKSKSKSNKHTKSSNQSNPVFYNSYGIRGSMPTFQTVKKDFPSLLSVHKRKDEESN